MHDVERGLLCILSNVHDAAVAGLIVEGANITWNMTLETPN